MLRATVFIITLWLTTARIDAAVTPDAASLPRTCSTAPCPAGYKCEPPQCVRVDESVCELPQQSGPCLAMMERYFYNTTSKRCERFTYGGCQANGNNFVHLQECLNTCKSPSGVCNQPKKVGPCRARIPRYFYNRTTGSCELFYWGGCQPNGNNFKILEQCQNSCERRDQCFYRGRWYPPGPMDDPSPCTSCLCTGGQRVCTTAHCPPPCSNPAPLRPGQCCPECL